MKSSIEKQRFVSILKRILNQIQYAMEDNAHPTNLTLSSIRSQIHSTIKEIES